MSTDLINQLGREAAKSMPPTLVTAYALISKGLPFIISFLTLVYLAAQLAYLIWKWIGEIERKREADEAARLARSVVP